MKYKFKITNKKEKMSSNKNYVSCNNMGGLGNQLFIIFTCITTAKKQDKDYRISKSQTSTFPRPTYWNELLSTLDYYSGNDFNPKLTHQERNHNIYTEIPNYDESFKINGYFQSSKYFNEYSNFVRENITLRPLDQKIVENKLKVLREKYIGKKLVWVHVRRTDYVEKSYYHLNLKMEYYIEAMSKFDKDETVFIFFSDDILWCKKTFDYVENKEFITDVDYRELILMSKLDGGVMANSTFSWWAAWIMDPKKEKKVITPRRWFRSGGDELPQTDRIEDHWEVLEVDIS